MSRLVAAAALLALALPATASADPLLPEAFTPREIANGDGDGYLIRTNRRIAEYGQPTYVRFLAEMNQANNGYCAYNHNGSSRGPSHSTRAFKQAWRRATLILRGGPIATINAALDRLGLPPVDLTEDLPAPQNAMLWVPQPEGTPNIRANRARAYWPGAEYGDWVGTDFYSKFPNFKDLETFYDDFPKQPFVFGEWAPQGDQEGAQAEALPREALEARSSPRCGRRRGRTPASGRRRSSARRSGSRAS